jgi:hypothetical protein
VKEIPPDEIFIIPARLDNTQPLFKYLLNLHMVDLFPSYHDGFEKIKQSLSLSGGLDTADLQPADPALVRDTQRIRAYRQLFDRPAFSIPCIFEYALVEVAAAMEDISAAMATGPLYSRSGRMLKDICPAGEFESPLFFSTLNEIRSIVYGLRGITETFSDMLAKESKQDRDTFQRSFHHMEFLLCDLIAQGSSREFVKTSFEYMDKIDIQRNNIIKKINLLLDQSHSKILPYITLSSTQLARSIELKENDGSGGQRWDDHYLRTHSFLRKALEEI